MISSRRKPILFLEDCTFWKDSITRARYPSYLRRGSHLQPVDCEKPQEYLTDNDYAELQDGMHSIRRKDIKAAFPT